MSYSSDVREEISRLPYGSADTAAAELAALIALSGTLIKSGGGVALKFELENALVIQRVIGLLSCVADVSPEVSESRGFKKTPLYSLKLAPGETESVMNRCFSYNGSIFFTPVPKPGILDKRGLKLSFCRGAYLGGGVILDPKKSYHLEFVSASADFAESLKCALLSLGFTAKLAERGEMFVVYIKSAEGIADFLTAIGAVRSRLELENIRIIKESRNAANRMTNCDSANISRTVDASERQIDAIRYISEKAGLKSLPNNLFITAEARINNPESPLSELSAMLGISRSGLNHRLDKILYLADALREENGDL